ncbi:MAG: Uma2 family endonuclease [Deltaproteobacteria bacterium]|nr:Uma2 family endonuclease [Deltaproteobacteria bacterium]
MPIPEQLKLTYDDYLNFPEDGKRYEIIDGEQWMTPAPQTRHQIVSRNIERILLNYIEDNELGQLFYAPTDVVLSDTTVVQPDLLFIKKDREHIIKRNFIEGPPDLMIEILSPGNEKLDRFTKMKHYALFGIGEYWLIDFEARILEQYVLKGQVFERTGVYGEDFSPSMFPDLTIHLSDVFKGPGF